MFILSLNNQNNSIFKENFFGDLNNFFKHELKAKGLKFEETILKSSKISSLIDFIKIGFNLDDIVKRVNQIIYVNKEGYEDISNIDLNLKKISEEKMVLFSIFFEKDFDNKSHEARISLKEIQEYLLKILKIMIGKSNLEQILKDLKFSWSYEVMQLTKNNKDLDYSDILTYMPQNKGNLENLQNILREVKFYQQFYFLYEEFSDLFHSFQINFLEWNETLKKQDGTESQEYECIHKIYSIRVILTKLLLIFMENNVKNSLEMKDFLENNDNLIKSKRNLYKQMHHQTLLQYTLYSKVFQNLTQFSSPGKISLFKYLNLIVNKNFEYIKGVYYFFDLDYLFKT